MHPYSYRDENGNTIPPQLQPFNSVGENAIDIKQGPGPISITNNIIHGFRPTLEGQDASGAMGVGITFHMYASGITIRKNHFYDNVIHLSVDKGDIAPSDQPSRDVIISDNIFEDAVEPNGVYADTTQRTSGLRIANVSDVQAFNNTFLNHVGNNTELLFLDNISNIELDNNLFYNGQIGTAPLISLA